MSEKDDFHVDGNIRILEESSLTTLLKAAEALGWDQLAMPFAELDKECPGIIIGTQEFVDRIINLLPEEVH